MKIITNNHKTKDAIIESNLTGATIICVNEIRVKNVIRFAKDLNIDIPTPISISNARGLVGNWSFNGRIIIDDFVDMMSIITNRHISSIDMITYRKSQTVKEKQKNVITRLINWLFKTKR